MNDIAAWGWAQAAVSKRLVDYGVEQPYLAEKYAKHLATMTAAQLKAGADQIRAVYDSLDEAARAAFETNVEQRDLLALLFEVAEVDEEFVPPAE